MAFGFGSLNPADDAALSPEMAAFIRARMAGVQSQPGADEVPAATAPGFTGYVAPTTPTGPATPVVDREGVQALGDGAKAIGSGLAGMGNRTADLFGRLRSGEIPAGAFAMAAGRHLAGNAYDAAQSAATAPRDAITGDLQVFGPDGHPTAEAMDRANGLAGLAMTGSLPFGAPKGAIRMFGGSSAETADHAALTQAMALAKSGADRRSIWDQTGWFKGADDRWKFEIPDDAAKFVPSQPGDRFREIGSAKAVIPHDPLYAAYPALADKAVRAQGGPRWPVGGSFSLTGAIQADGPNAASVRTVLLHELQHGVQESEGFARGGSPASYTRQDWAASAGSAPADAAGFKDWARDQYHRQAGEVEARNVQAREFFTPEQRRAIPPWETQDVPDAQQIIRLYSGGPGGLLAGLPAFAQSPSSGKAR